MLTMLFLSTFAGELGPVDGEWTVPNPIGFIPLGGWVDAYLMPVWFVLLPLLTIGCAAALFVRFRRARGVEREQIEWLFFAGAIFVAVYVPRVFGSVIGEQLPVVIVLSTLLVAALFTSLRRRVQEMLAQFALAARDETDLDSLNEELQRVIEQTLQPEDVAVWLRSERIS